jgi:hypothetical protein
MTGTHRPAANCSPSGVSVTRRLVRSNSFPPISRSRAAISRLTRGWELAACPRPGRSAVPRRAQGMPLPPPCPPPAPKFQVRCGQGCPRRRCAQVIQSLRDPALITTCGGAQAGAQGKKPPSARDMFIRDTSPWVFGAAAPMAPGRPVTSTGDRHGHDELGTDLGVDHRRQQGTWL